MEKKLTSLFSSTAAMILVVLGTLYWMYVGETFKDVIDSFLSGGAMLFGQANYKENAPREQALHAKLDAIIDATDADKSKKRLEEK